MIKGPFKSLILPLVLCLGFMGVGFVTQALSTEAQKHQQAEQLAAFLEANHATPKQKQAYQYAFQHPEVLRYIPCFCGCGRQGHKSNYNCFIKETAKSSQKQPFDRHGFVCPMCVQIALDAEKRQQAGMPLPKIREQIDAGFQSYKFLEPTLTPKPAETPSP